MTPSSYRATTHSGGTILLPPDLRLPEGLWMHAACSRLGLLAYNGVGLLSRLSLSLLPGRATTWSPPLEDELWRAWLDSQQPELDIAPSRLVVQLPRDRRRRRFAFLVLDRSGSAQAFVKFTRNPQSHLMIRALDQLDRASEEPPFWFPRILDHGEVGDWSYTVTSTMRQGPHRPAPLDTSERRRVIDALQSELLDGGIGDGESTFPVHADFGPWNVRVVDRRIAIIDWEEMTTGPVAADELWHGLSVGLLKGGDPVACAHDVSTSLDHRTADEIDAAAAWWQARLRRPEPPEIEEGVSMPSSLESLPKRVASALDAIRKG